MRNIIFSENEFYHLYNRGVDKRNIFSDKKDIDRFLESMASFNALEPIGSIFENHFKDKSKNAKSNTNKKEKLVNFIAYCLNPNHYHFILEQLTERGIEKFMHRIGTGYTKYFNTRYKRSGSLFQGRFKAVHINSNEQLLHLSAYVNLNDKAHQLGSSASKLGGSQSSLNEYLRNMNTGVENSFCDKEIVLGQFRNIDEYREFAHDALKNIIQTKREFKENYDYLLE